MLKIIFIATTEQSDILMQNIGDVSDFQVVGFYNPLQAHQKNAAMNAIEMMELASKAHCFITTGELYSQFCEIFEHFIRQGKDILIDGFIHSDYSTLKKLENLCIEGQNTFQIANVLRNKPIYAAASQVVNKPRFIKLEKHTSNPQQGLFEQWVFNNLAQEIDAILRLSAAKVRTVQAKPHYLYSSTPDMLSVHIEFDNDAIFQITAGNTLPSGTNTAQFFQNDRLIKIDFNNTAISEFRLNDSQLQLSMLHDGVNTNEFTEIERPIMLYDTWRKEYINFIECRTKGLSPITSIADCIELQTVIDGIMDKIYRKYVAV